MIVATCQRWRDRREYRVPLSRIDPAILSVDVVDEARCAKPFVIRHHYSGTFPAARLCVGLYRHRELVGIAVFSEGMQPRAVPKWTGGMTGCELGRFVLLDDVPGNAESWFLARAFRALRREKPAVEAVLSYSDPEPRFDPAGRLTKPGHVGTIYQAMSALYRGRASPRTDYVTPFGEHISRRALSKIMLGERGEGYAVDQLHRLGAPRREFGEGGRAWVSRLIDDERWLRTSRHPGNHTYVFPLSARARAAGRRLSTLPYPKLARCA
jgi:hypothetical protein